jgi:hypothetical protein
MNDQAAAAHAEHIREATEELRRRLMSDDRDRDGNTYAHRLLFALARINSSLASDGEGTTT